ncbi:MAG: AraC-like DNA-binding protein [Candidatus Azotimanducaceae bacterium]|jgi:AraC-like DNA-binding protein
MIIDRLQRDLLKQLLIELEKAKVNPNKLFSTSGVVKPNQGQHALAGAESLLLLEAATKLTGDHSLVFRLGQQIGIDSYGTFGFALMSCANLRESLDLLLRYGKVFFKPNWKVHDHDGGLMLRLNLTLGTPAQQRLVAELCFSQLSTIGSSLYRGRLEGAELHFNFPEPSHAIGYLSTLKAAVSFGGEHNQLFLPTRVLDTPVRTASQPEYVVFHQQCEEMLRSLNSVEKTTTAVRNLLIQSAGEFLNISQAAERLYVSERTLRRRLAAESTSFRATFDEIKDLLAREYLADTQLTVAEIAHLLDYSETVNFRRAFVRWNGATPSQYRQQQSV